MGGHPELILGWNLAFWRVCMDGWYAGMEPAGYALCDVLSVAGAMMQGRACASPLTGGGFGVASRERTMLAESVSSWQC